MRAFSYAALLAQQSRKEWTRSSGSLFVELGDVLSDAEVLDKCLKSWVLGDFDVLDLDFGSVGDEIHLSLSFLWEGELVTMTTSECCHLPLLGV